MNRILVGAVVALALGVAWQTVHLLAGGPPRVNILRPGFVLPANLAFEEECWTGYFVMPDCEGCRQLVERAHEREDLRWIMVGKRASIDSLLRRFPIQRGQVRIALEQQGEPNPLTEIGVKGVPTRISASGSKVVRVRAGGTVIPGDSTRFACSQKPE